MRNRILSLLMLVTFGASLSPAAAKIAVVTKVKGMVEMERDKSGFNALKPGIILEDGDRIRTGSNGFTALIYIDDKSLLKIKENTEIVITGKRDVNSISKEANISQGTLRASVGKQKKGEFVVKSPTSVASVKGTVFDFISDPNSGDQVIGIEGIIALTNTLTGASIDVTEGITGFSDQDGSLNSAPTDPSTIPTYPEDEETGGSSFLKIILEGPDGDEKTIIIEYQ
ncbi:MAG: FecR family protein [Candidatus Marinimicrobia bacterium]|nr:FecR family protein [Candidatus Neomarinimicrobiota bacterium]MDP6790200.1 FecR family protein [Candidatus Neomarinimicrobiota bacterium]MDP7072761.1 FecR family protein [Candidatus Neomarinimicrobiota bacterium]